MHFFCYYHFWAVAALYVFAGADFIAVTQIMVYVGGILVMLIYGVMFTNRQKNVTGMLVESKNLFLGLGVAILLFSILAKGIYQTDFDYLPSSSLQESSIDKLGVGLMTDYLIPFELSAILLLVALMGAATIAWHGSHKHDN